MISTPSDAHTSFPGLLSGDKEKKEILSTPVIDCRESMTDCRESFPVGYNLLPCLDDHGLT